MKPQSPPDYNPGPLPPLGCVILLSDLTPRPLAVKLWNLSFSKCPQLTAWPARGGNDLLLSHRFHNVSTLRYVSSTEQVCKDYVQSWSDVHTGPDTESQPHKLADGGRGKSSGGNKEALPKSWSSRGLSLGSRPSPLNAGQRFRLLATLSHDFSAESCARKHSANDLRNVSVSSLQGTPAPQCVLS